MSKEKEEVPNELESFTWDDNAGTNLEFFGKPADGDETVLTEEEKQELNTEEPKEELKEESKEEPEAEPKEETEETTEEETTEEPKEEAPKDPKFFEETTEETPEEAATDNEVFSILAKELKEQGIFSSVEIPEGEITEESFVKLQEDEIENRIQETFEGFFEELDEDGAAFLKFKKEGGSTKEFFDVMRSTSSYPTGNIDDESYQKKIAKFYAETVEGLDADEADEKVIWLDENGKLEKYAKRYETKVRKLETEEKETIQKQQEAKVKTREENEGKFKEVINATLKEAEEIKSFTIAPKEKPELLNYITKQTVKVGKNHYITALQHDLNQLGQNPENLILLAKMLKSDFDTSGLDTKIETKKTIGLKKSIQRSKKNVKPNVSTGSGKATLADFFS